MMISRTRTWYNLSQIEFPNTFHNSEEVIFSGFLIDINYETVKIDNEQCAELILYLRNTNGTRSELRINNYKPYFYAELDENKYFQITKANKELLQWTIEHSNQMRLTYKGGHQIELLKLKGKRPWEVPRIRKILENYEIRNFEADIPFTHRYMIDNELFGLKFLSIRKSEDNDLLFDFTDKNFEPTILSLDIEIDSATGVNSLPESLASIMDNANRRITAISAWGGKDVNHGSGYSFILQEDSDQAEKGFLISSFKSIWNNCDPDVLVTYNGDTFDFPYLIKRLNKLGISSAILSPPELQAPKKSIYNNKWMTPGLLIYDLFRRTKWKYTADGSKSLDSISHEILGEGKRELSLDHGRTWRQSLVDDSFKHSFNNYILKDAELTYKLWFSLEMPEWLEVIKITGAPPGEAMNFTERQAGEFLVYRNMYRNKILIPPLPSKEGKKLREKNRERTKGGLVFDPSKEFATAVLICDFTSMYPSVVVTHNIGAESFRGLKHELKDRFNEYPRTSMTVTQESLLSERHKIKLQLNLLSENTDNSREITILKRHSWAIKLLMNSLIGGYNFVGSRLYSSDLSNTVTGLGRQYLQEVSEQVKKFNNQYEVIYGDTDSVFIETTLKKETEALWELPNSKSVNHENYVPEYSQLIEYLQSTLSSKMKLELQDIAFRILFHKATKKRYTYISAINKKVSIIGFEAIRHDWSPFAKLGQREAINLILTTGDLEFAKREMIYFIRSQLKKPEKEIFESMTILGAIKRDPKKYKNITAGINAFRHYVMSRNEDEQTQWRQYEYFPYIITRGSGAIRDRAFHPEFVKFNEIDFDQYINESLRAINRFNLNITSEEIRGYHQTNLDDYFKENNN